MHAQQNPMFGLENPRRTGYNAYGAICIAVLSGCVTRTGPQGVGSALRPAAYMFPKAILTYRGRNCKGVFGKSLYKRTFPLFYRHFPDLLIFSGYFWILAVFDKNRLFLHHGQDLLKFRFFLNLAAGFEVISFKKSGGAKSAFIAFRGQVVILG